MVQAETSPQSRQQPLASLRQRAAEQSAYKLDLSAPIDGSRLFVCPTTTPLYYAPIYPELTDEQRRRYNQLTAMCFNELVLTFETEFSANILTALAKASRTRQNRELADCLDYFRLEERRHAQLWRDLNRLSNPSWYAESDQYITRPPWLGRRLMRGITRRPQGFAVVLWLMLALEERSVDVSRRSLRLDGQALEPRYRAMHHGHLADETRHVQIDWHLIEQVYAARPKVLRIVNAWLLRQIIGRYFLPPNRAALRVVRLLVREHPELRGREAVMRSQLRALKHDEAYHAMMYSRQSTPILFMLLDRFPEMRPLRKALLTYEPPDY